MYFPSTRLLNILDLLRSHGQLTARELAGHLEVDTRTVRRYMVMLEDLGMPVETVRGRYGGYRLRAGYHLPPVVFAESEALTLILGLLLVKHLGLTNASNGTEVTLAKLSRVMPAALRNQLPLLNQALTMRLPKATVAAPGESLLQLMIAAHQRQQVILHYQATNGHETVRQVDPYGIVYTIGFWYLVGYCHLRQALRVFRLDRIQQVQPRETYYTKQAEIDLLSTVEASIAQKPWIWSTQIQLFVDLASATSLIPPAMATLTATAEGVLMHCEVDDLRELAHFLLGLPCQLAVIQPDELGNELLHLADRARELADRPRSSTSQIA